MAALVSAVNIAVVAVVVVTRDGKDEQHVSPKLFVVDDGGGKDTVAVATISSSSSSFTNAFGESSPINF